MTGATRRKPAPTPYQPTPDEALWTVDEVAAYLRWEPTTVRDKARRGELPGVKVGKSRRARWLFKRAEILKLAEPAHPSAPVDEQ